MRSCSVLGGLARRADWKKISDHIQSGQVLKFTPSRPKPCYPVRDADAGSVPCSASRGQMAETLLIDAKTGTPVQALRGIELPSSLFPDDFVPTRNTHRHLGLMVSFCGGNGRRRFRRDARHTVRQFPSQNGFHREAQVADQQQVRDALALPFGAISE